MNTWKKDIITQERKNFLNDVKYRKVHKTNFEKPVESFKCIKRPEGNTFCLVGNEKNIYYVPIEKKKGKCSFCLHGHPCINMTQRCGRDVAKDKIFHGKKAQKLWNKECEFDKNDNLKKSDKVCKKKKTGKCIIS